MKTLHALLENNRCWAAELVSRHPTFFETLARQQKPEYLWIGCSDSRVPANQIVGLAPGEVFVHRNIANQVIHSDLNCMSVIEFAVHALGVKHIIVCGHYGCGGVQTAMEAGRWVLVNQWIHHIRELRRRHHHALEEFGDFQDQFDRLCELNVIEQVNKLCRSPLIENAWSEGKELCVHGWIYRIDDGLITDLNISIAHSDEVATTVAAAVKMGG